MNDLNTLHSAFDELERRADSATASSPFHLPAPRRAARSRALVPVVATVAVAGMATGAIVLAQNGGEATGPNSVPAAGPSSSVAAPTTPAPERIAPITFPNTADDLAERFRRVLGDAAKLKITEAIDGEESPEPPKPSSTPADRDDGPTSTRQVVEQSWAFIKGTLTAFGSTGGFDLQITPSKKITVADPSPEKCTQYSVREICIRTLDDGSILTMQEVELQQGGVTYDVELIRADGITIMLHLSNASDPKGPEDAENLSPEPPLTMNQLEEIVTSGRW